jgi:hypothetical protein
MGHKCQTKTKKLCPLLIVRKREDYFPSVIVDFDQEIGQFNSAHALRQPGSLSRLLPRSSVARTFVNSQEECQMLLRLKDLYVPPENNVFRKE